MVKLKGDGRFECRNETCPVIEVRVRKRKGGGIIVFRDSIMASRVMRRQRRKKTPVSR